MGNYGNLAAEIHYGEKTPLDEVPGSRFKAMFAAVGLKETKRKEGGERGRGEGKRAEGQEGRIALVVNYHVQFS